MRTIGVCATQFQSRPTFNDMGDDSGPHTRTSGRPVVRGSGCGARSGSARIASELPPIGLW